MAYKKNILRSIFFLGLYAALSMGLVFISAFLIKQKMKQNNEKIYPHFDILRDYDKVSIAWNLPHTNLATFPCVAGSFFKASITITNTSPHTLVSSLDPLDPSEKKINVGYRFLDKETYAVAEEGPRFLFTHPVASSISHKESSSQTMNLRIACPKEKGTFLLVLSLVQEMKGWQYEILNKSLWTSLYLETKDFNSVQNVETPYFSTDQSIELKLTQLGLLNVLKAYTLAKNLLFLTADLYQEEERSYLVTNAGSQYPMVWVRDMATIQKAYALLKPVDNLKKNHWSELFFKYQDPSGSIPDWLELTGPSREQVKQDKNDVSSDQELWLLESVLQAYDDGWISKEKIESFGPFFSQALGWLVKNRYKKEEPCFYTGHTVDWGDVGLQGSNSQASTKMEHQTPLVCGVYEQSLFIYVVDRIKEKNFLGLIKSPEIEALGGLEKIADQVRNFVQSKLWNEEKGFFHIHQHLSSFAHSFDENSLFALWGNFLAIKAKLTSYAQSSRIIRNLFEHQKLYHSSTISSVLLPSYPENTYQNPILQQTYTYQNGGQWDWIGGQVIGIVSHFDLKTAQNALSEISDKVLKNGTFYEWDHLDGKPGAGAHFRAGAASFILAVHEFIATQDKVK